MTIQKNFVIQNGLEVNNNLIFADKDTNKVGIGTTNPLQKFQIGVANTLGHSTDGKVFVVTAVNATAGTQLIDQPLLF